MGKLVGVDPHRTGFQLFAQTQRARPDRVQNSASPTESLALADQRCFIVTHRHQSDRSEICLTGLIVQPVDGRQEMLPAASELDPPGISPARSAAASFRQLDVLNTLCRCLSLISWPDVGASDRTDGQPAIALGLTPAGGP